VKHVFLILLLLALALLPACSSKGSSGDETDTDTDTESDTDTGPVEWGETNPCENEPLPGEVCIPGGKYVMGCVPGDQDCEANELPLVEVILSPFFIEVEEVAYPELLDLLNALGDGYTKLGGAVWDDANEDWLWSGEEIPIRLNGNDQYVWDETPDDVCKERNIEDVAGGLSWLAAKMLCEDKGKQLPTEAQWEAAARGQTLSEYPCGTDIADCAYGWVACCESIYECYDELCGQCCIPMNADTATGCPSPFGPIHMAGNALEWVADKYAGDHSSCENGCVDPVQTDGEYPVVKGGGIAGDVKDSRVSFRQGAQASTLRWTGARCARPDEPFATQDDAGPDGGM
jgi:formylglycine-generating enzyme required for sulfatase activity